ncbi:MAG: hypothetical protein JWP13_868 [Candidatus Saccharibacteria bacterium]|nr:hypothetical protein [Candidatus Saccharibacteria bacterium]
MEHQSHNSHHEDFDTNDRIGRFALGAFLGGLGGFLGSNYISNVSEAFVEHPPLPLSASLGIAAITAIGYGYQRSRR